MASSSARDVTPGEPARRPPSFFRSPRSFDTLFRRPRIRQRLALLALALLALGLAADQYVLRRETRAAWLGRLPTFLVRGLAAAGDAPAHYELGRRHRLDGNSGAAERSFRLSSQLDPGFVTARGAYANLLVDLNCDIEAYPLAQQCLSEERDSVDASLALGRLRARRREWKAGLVAAEIVLRDHQASGPAWLLQAECQRGLRQTPAAAHSAARAVQLEPRLWAGWVLLAEAAKERGDAAEARRCAERAARLRPQEASAQRELGLALLEQPAADTLPSAVVALGAALRLAPNDAEARVGWGRALLLQGRSLEARRHLEETVRGWPEANDARALLAATARDQGEAERARSWQREHARWAAFLRRKEALQARIDASEYDHRARFELARVYSGMGLWARARRELDLGLQRGPDPAGLALRREFDRRQAGGGSWQTTERRTTSNK